MNYSRIYDRLIERARTRTLVNVYSERHHVVPRCEGGTDDAANLVELTPEEHYVAHQLLTKMYPNSRGLMFAAVAMTAGYGRMNNKLFGWVRRRSGLINKGRSPTPEVRARIAATLRGRPACPIANAKRAATLRGKKRVAFTAEHREAIAEAGRKRAPISEATRDKLRSHLIGKPGRTRGNSLTEEHKRKLSEAAKLARARSVA